MNLIDLRSDTVTHPTEEMREAMARAEVGDDVYGDDPTVNRLEEYAAQLVGKEAALFVPSGTFGNQLALMTHCKRGDEVILDETCHIVAHEAGAAAVLAGVNLRTTVNPSGQLIPAAVKSRIRTPDVHHPDTALICMENAHSNGIVGSLEYMSDIYRLARENGLPVHLDGARLFNAADYLKVDAREIAGRCDSVMFCLSKGLCAPVGSMLAGTRGFVDLARRGRKIMGGGMRQAGILAAAGLIALEKMRLRVGEDRENALALGREIAKLPGVKVNLEQIHINMVFADLSGTGVDPEAFADGLRKRGILINSPDNGILRLVTHYWVRSEHVSQVSQAIKEVLAG
ncbi:MAG: low-specificity L-threonine aldolase [Firmicutes bacterium]|nr:low-specificity L-threonine aldolase [Bacillota bacterium]